MARKIITDSVEKLFGSEWERLLKHARQRDAKRFLLFWNRGLGDIALGMYQVIAELRGQVSDAEITILTRPELAEPFRLLPIDHVLIDKALVRGEKNDVKLAFERIDLKVGAYDIVLERVDPTRWFRDKPRLQPRLNWPARCDALCNNFDSYFNVADDSCITIGAHVQSETASFYGYQKDWPAESWRALFERFAQIGSRTPVRFVLFGHGSNSEFDHPNCIDLRGKTSFLEMMALIKNRCRIVIAPDSGVLTMTYYLDVETPIGVISLWADPLQGILKQGVPSPNRLLQHVPLIGDDEKIASIGVEKVASAVESMLDTLHL